MPFLGRRTSDVLATTVAVAGTSASRQTVLTPTAGKQVRVISVQAASAALSTAPGRVSFYFGTGAAYTTTISKVIGQVVPTITGQQMLVWAEGDGPIGAVNDVVSAITETETETTMSYTLVYREE